MYFVFNGGNFSTHCPGFPFVCPVASYDFALLRLERGIDLASTSSNVRPICWEHTRYVYYIL